MRPTKAQLDEIKRDIDASRGFERSFLVYLYWAAFLAMKSVPGNKSEQATEKDPKKGEF